MAIGFVLQFDGVTKDDYEAVCGPENLDLRSPGNPTGNGEAAELPAGALHHVAGSNGTGWTVVDVWESRAAFDAFLSTTLGPALGKVGLPEPKVTTFEVYNSLPA
jgi:hypothetical protein